jgi:hypothetical protein
VEGPPRFDHLGRRLPVCDRIHVEGKNIVRLQAEGDRDSRKPTNYDPVTSSELCPFLYQSVCWDASRDQGRRRDCPVRNALPLLREPIFQHHRVKDLSARNASPSEKVLADPIKLLINHHPAASMASHNDLPQHELDSTLQV